MRLNVSRMPSFKLLFLGFLVSSLSPPINGVTLLRGGNLSCNDKQQIVSQHNQLRQRVALGHVPGQPPASNMKEMVWDEELASIAQNWANRCNIAHNTPRSGRFPVGENIAATWTFGNQSPSGSTPDFSKAIRDWFGESSLFPGTSVAQYRFNVNTGHYSQIVWANTHLIGCGFSYFIDPQKGYTKFYVCNYGSAGNIIGGKTYEPGQPSCPNYRLIPSPRFPGLCEVPNSNPGAACRSPIPSAAILQAPRLHHQSQQHYVHHPFYWGR